MRQRLSATWIAWGAALVLAACASTQVVNSWFDPAYQGRSFKRVAVIVVTRQPTTQRIFEDAFAARLRASGGDAVTGSSFLPEGGAVEEAAMNAAVKASGADALLMVRLLRVDRETRETVSYAPVVYPGYYGYYTAWIAYPDLYEVRIARAEVNLFDVASGKLVWGGQTETFDPRNVTRDSAGFADVVIDELARRGLVPPRR